MRVLLIKMSSMGDVFHTFPALSDAQRNVSGLTIDWVVEKGFSDIPSWHPVVDKVFPIEVRRWRKSLFSSQTRQEIKAFFNEINLNQYDLIIDAQGLLKSAWVSRKVKAKTAGYDWFSIREPLASLFYQFKYPVSKDLHAISRLRTLFAQALDYDYSNDLPIVYGLDTQTWAKPEQLINQFAHQNYWVFLHSTTWDTKLWPEDFWLELLDKAKEQGVMVMLPWGNEAEKLRAESLKSAAEKNAEEPFIWAPNERLSLNDIAKVLKNAQGVVSVDTGLSHVSAALEVPMVALYRVTDPKLIGADGSMVTRLVSPCAPEYLKQFQSSEQEKQSLEGLSPQAAYEALLALINLRVRLSDV